VRGGESQLQVETECSRVVGLVSEPVDEEKAGGGRNGHRIGEEKFDLSDV
jgi:hypothetical protein